MPDRTISEHQANLRRAFEWIEFAYQHGKTLLERTRTLLSDANIPGTEQFGCAYSASRNFVWRYVWIDAFLYLPDHGDNADRAAFAALSYHSSDWIGSHLMLGTISLDPSEPDLLERIAKSGHWVLDYAFGSTEHQNKFTKVERDGLVEYTPGPGLAAEFGPGIQGLVCAPFPVSWFQEEKQLTDATSMFVGFARGGTGARLGELSQAAREAAT